MGVDLYNRGCLSLNWHTWRACLERAMEHGWEPAGTIAPPDFEGQWPGSYFSDDFQLVSDSDAAKLAEALFAALEAIKAAPPLATWNAMHLEMRMLELAHYARRGSFAIG